MPELKAVIFDLDGILVDTSVYHARAWADLVRSLGYEPPDDLEERVKGISRMASLKIALGENARRYSEDELVEMAARKNACYLRAVKDVRPADLFEGALELFDDLRAAGVKIVLGSASKNAKPVLDGLGIAEQFDAVADGYTYKHGKPHPDVFITGARMAGAEPAECIVVEDAAAGVSAAADGGFVTVGMGTYESLRHANLYVRSLVELDARRLIELHGRCRSDRWTVVRDALGGENEPSLGTILSVGNGNIGVRGHLPELPGSGPAGVYVAGLYDKLRRRNQDPDAWSDFLKYWGMPELAGPQVESCIINCPDVLDVAWTVEGEPIDLATGELRSLRRSLDMHTGTFTAEAHWVSPDGRELRLTRRRFAAMDRPDRLFVQYVIEPLNFAGTLTARAGIDTTTVNNLEGMPQRLYEVTESAAAGERAVAVGIRGRADGAEAAFATGLTVLDRPQATYRVESSGDRPGVAASTEVRQDELLYLDRVSVFATARRTPGPLAAVKGAVAEALAQPFGQARIAHAARWHELWGASDVRIEPDADDQRAIRFSIYHLLIAASADDAGVSIPAKGLTGEGYRGMVFWDTDIHMVPFYVYTQPRRARSLVAFRCRTLDGAREKAATWGFAGASYPWETGASGREECEKWLKLITHQSHITSDVAYAIQQYVDATRDADFYVDEAAEVLIETGRFWLSKAVEAPDGRLSIPDAGGPDEFHVVSDDSAYVNHMAILNLLLADAAVRHLREHAPERLEQIVRTTGATEPELARFADAAARIRTLVGPDGLIEQCRGFFGLRDEIDPRHGGPRPFETQCVKQADVLMLLYLLPDRFSHEALRVNWDYYEPRTIHASSLSHGVHGILAARLGLFDKADAYCRRSLGMDLNDEMNNAAGGIHMAANGMNWSAMVRGYGGARPQGERFLIQPRLPERWSRLAFRLTWRGADFAVDIRREGMTVRNAESAAAALPLRLCGENVTLRPGQHVTALLT